MNTSEPQPQTCQRPAWIVRQWRRLRGKGCKGWMERLFVCLPEVIDSGMRHLDRIMHSSYRGAWQRLFMQGHSLLPFLFTFTAIGFTVVGPTPRFRGELAVVGIIAAAALFWLTVRYWLAKRGSAHGLLSLQIGIIFLLAIFFYILPGAGPVEADGVPYRHIFTPIILMLLLLAALSQWIAARVLSGYPARYRVMFSKLLPTTELFVKPWQPHANGKKVLHGFINAPLYHPLHLLLLPSFGVILVKPHYVWIVAGVLLLVAWSLLLFTGIHDRLSLMIKIVQRWFLIGGQLVISLVIIVLAIARLADIHYVTTLLDSTPGQVILGYVVAAYTAFWLYEYWINRALSERMLPLLLPLNDKPERVVAIDYPIQPDAVTTEVEANDRWIEVFSGARFVAVGFYQPSDSQGLCRAWESYEKIELFAHIAERAQCMPNLSSIKKYQVKAAVGELHKRTRLYFNIMNLLLVFVFGLGFYGLHLLKQDPIAVGNLVTTENTSQQVVNLREMLFEQPRASNKVIIVAASGGGTRAALYTASLLRGIAKLESSNDIVLLSGVSGGGAALAYFALHRDTLLEKQPANCGVEQLNQIEKNGESISTSDPWCAYVATMAKPYIEDVLRGLPEVKIFTHKSLGQLLSESFVRGFRVNPNSTPFMLSDIKDVGLILNTALAGHPATTSPWLSELYKDKLGAKDQFYSTASGGRLIFTNIKDVSAFPVPTDALQDAKDEYQTYVIVGGKQTAVTAAAALNANFPPVFANGAVDILSNGSNDVLERYWVTDGGAIDNRGIISLLYALQSALDEQSKACGNKCKSFAMQRPEIHLVIADASAATIDYHADRGVGSKFGAAQKFASQLMLKQIAKAKKSYGDMGGQIHEHYLSMPAVLRMRGGLGTHWMMPVQVTLKDITEPDPDKAKTLTIDRLPLISLITQLHDSNSDKCGEPQSIYKAESDTPEEWVKADPHACAWNRLVKELNK
ncbi:MAG: hypothetical protein HKM94_12390 [Halobacteria archaeon]|nr:hypothetical protein [Halobacteria archaeon]